MAEVAPDTLIDGRYRVVERLGSGGMADVFCAEDVQLGRRVALKVLHRRFAADREFVERFRREAQSAAGLQHPNVVGVYDRGEWDGTYYIAMEYLPGRTLKDLIREEAPLDPLRAVDIATQLLKAARFAHRRGVIHRDFKPQNAIVDEEGRVKVTDFGIARAGASDMTQTGSILGTAQYLSPEQAQGHAVSARSDLYAIGVILYEMLTGRLPFEGESAVTIALKHVTEPPPSIRSYNPSVPPELESVVLWALEKDAERRPPDADAFLAALQGVRDRLTGAPSGERTAAFAPVPPPPSEVATAYAPAPVLAPVPPPDEPPPPADEPGGRWWAWLLALIAVLALAAGGYALYRALHKDKVAVPNVVGRNLVVAQTRLQNDGFTVNVTRRNSPKPKDEVIGQNPLAGQKVAEGSTVTLIVSDGPGQGIVPEVSGLPRARAEKALRKAGFKVSVRTEASDSVAEGHAIRTAPSSGTQIDKGATVTLFVSSGPRLVSVPDVVGSDVDAATAELRSAGFEVSTTERESKDKTPGTVLSQSPAGGTDVRKGTTVKLVVAKEAKISVPDVTGEPSDQAVNDVSSANLQPVVKTKTVTDPNQDGTVISQTPKAGSQVAKGSKVTIVVGKFTANPNPGEQTPGTGTGTTGNGTSGAAPPASGGSLG